MQLRPALTTWPHLDFAASVTWKMDTKDTKVLILYGVENIHKGQAVLILYGVLACPVLLPLLFHQQLLFFFSLFSPQPAYAFQALEESGLPKKLRMVVMCNKPSFEFRAFQVGFS